MATAEQRKSLDANAIRDGVVAARSMWQRVDVVSETGSTNADLVARSAGEDVAGAVLLAESQIAGRGRNGRAWVAVPYAQISMSVGVPVTGVPTAAWGWVPLATGVAVVDAIAETTGVAAGLKWPNDVLAGPGRGKLAGILAEVATPAPVVVVGIGLNVSLAADELPDPAATSLLQLDAAELDRTRLVVAILRHLEVRLTQLVEAAGADDGLLADYTGRSLTMGLRVRALLPGGGELVGDAESIDRQGRLRVDTGSGIVPVSAGDIVHLRPA